MKGVLSMAPLTSSSVRPATAESAVVKHRFQISIVLTDCFQIVVAIHVNERVFESPDRLLNSVHF